MREKHFNNILMARGILKALHKLFWCGNPTLIHYVCCVFFAVVSACVQSLLILWCFFWLYADSIDFVPDLLTLCLCLLIDLLYQVNFAVSDCLVIGHFDKYNLNCNCITFLLSWRIPLFVFYTKFQHIELWLPLLLNSVNAHSVWYVWSNRLTD